MEVWLRTYRNRSIVAVVVLAVWLLLGAGVYYACGNCSEVDARLPDGTFGKVKACPWNFAQSFYFSVQTGLSIGFGLFSESTTASQAYSIFHIILGSSTMGGALAIFAHIVLLRMSKKQALEHKIVSDALARMCMDDYASFDARELHRLLIDYPRFAETVICRIEADPVKAQERIDTYAGAEAKERRRLAEELTGQAIGSIHALADDIRLASTESERIIEPDGCVTFMRELRAHKALLVNSGIMLVWLAVGVLFSVFADHRDFVTALHFSVGTLSTAGMVAVRTVESNKHVLFAAFFALTGVPIFATFLGSFANMLVESFNLPQTRIEVHDRLINSEKAFAERWIEQGNKEHLPLADFMELQLLRMGRVDRDLVQALRRQFKAMDQSQNGVIDATKLWGKGDMMNSLSVKEA